MEAGKRPAHEVCVSVTATFGGSSRSGNASAKCVARGRGRGCIEPDAVVEKPAAGGAPANELGEALVKPPTFLERFTRRRRLCSSGMPPPRAAQTLYYRCQ